MCRPRNVHRVVAEVEAERRRLLAILNQPIPPLALRMSRDQISELVGTLGDIIDAFREADPADRAEVYRQLGLR